MSMDKHSGHVRANDGVRLYYDESGVGRHVILIHGGGLSNVWWRRNFPVLAQRFHVIAPDTRGCGRSDKPDWGHRTARYAKDVRDIIETLGLHDVTLVGWSIGARTTYSYLELFGSDRLRGAVIVDETVHITLHDPPSPGKPQQCGESDDDFDRRWLADMFNLENFDRLTDDEKAWMIASRSITPGSQTLSQDYLAQDWRPLCPTIDLPVLIATGRHAGAYIGCVYAAEHIPGAKLEVFENSGHVMFYEEADKFNRVVADFVDRPSQE